MKIIRRLGSLIFVLGLFTAIFGGIPWAVIVEVDPVVPWWLRIAIFAFLGGMLIVLFSLSVEQMKLKKSMKKVVPAEQEVPMLLLNSPEVTGRKTTEILGLVQGHTIFAVWLGKDLSALMRLILGGELTEYTVMMGSARKTATNRMISQAKELGADAVINVRYMTNSVVGSAAELLAYGTAVKLEK